VEVQILLPELYSRSLIGSDIGFWSQEFWFESRGEFQMIKHDFYKDPLGEVDVWRIESDYHNGPQCMRCGWGACHHCSPEIYDEDCLEQTPYLF
jgi:hypothetical protein